MEYTCRNCSGKDLFKVIDLGEMPIAHRILNSKDEDEPLYPLSLHLCRSCGLIQICNYIEPKLLYLDYNFCFSNWKSQMHMSDEADSIFEHCGNDKIFEVACNDGMFLKALKDKGARLVVGLEPNPIASKIAEEKGFKVYNEMLTDSICRKVIEEFGKFKVIIARQVLEHLPDLDNFFKCVDILLEEGGFLFVDVPDIEKHISLGDITVIWEEHVNYFYETLMRDILKKLGYDLIFLKRYNYSGGVMAFITKKVRSLKGNNTISSTITKNILDFDRKTREYGGSVKKVLTDFRNKGFKIVLYGVGCRACTFVNGHKIGGFIDFAIDDQKEKQGKYMPGNRLPIFSPQTLDKEDKPIIILLAVNQENEDNVKKKLNGSVKANVEFISIFSPTDIWEDLERVKKLI